MRQLNTKVALMATILSGSVAMLVAPVANAGNCAGYSQGVCQPAATYNTSSSYSVDAVSVTNRAPMEHLRSTRILTAPQVSITRLYSETSGVSLEDSPSGFASNGCFPGSTGYCKSNVAANWAPGGVATTGTGAAAYGSAAYGSAGYGPAAYGAAAYGSAAYGSTGFGPAAYAGSTYATAPMPLRPSYASTGTSGLNGYTLSGYEGASSTARVYGSTDVVRGIVHAPTSYIDRSVSGAQAALSGSSAIPAGYYNNSVSTSYGSGSYGTSYGAAPASPYTGYSAEIIGSGSYGSGNSYGSGSYNTGSYNTGGEWKKVSGPRFLGSTLATEIVCRVPSAQPQTRVVRPIVAVPYAVPTAVPVCRPTGGVMGKVKGLFGKSGSKAANIAPYRTGYGPLRGSHGSVPGWTY